MDESIAIACGSTLFFGTLSLIVFGFFAYLRHLRYKETIALAEKGLLRPERRANGKGTLRWGIVITALGIALCLGLYPFGWLAAPGEFPLNFGPWMVFGLVPTFFGLALVLIYYLTSREGREEVPGPETQNYPGVEEELDLPK
jgi:hypothetical protein